MKTGKTLLELATELDRQNKAKRDFVVDTRNLALNLTEEGFLTDLKKPNENMLEIERFATSGLMHRQIGNFLNIPAKYYDKMQSEYPELLTANVNGWFQKNPSRRMIRTLDGNARAFLSDRYRRIDNYEIAQAVLPILNEMPGAKVESCEVTENKMYLKVVNPRLEAEIDKGDIVQAGIVISNSEVGHGAASVMPLVYRLVCLNGMTVNDAGQRKFHTGRAIESDYELFRDETIEADDRAFLLRMQDITRSAIDEVKFKTVVNRMKDAKGVKITGDIPTVVELASREMNLTAGESSNILTHLIEGGDLSLFGLSSAVTRASQDIESYDRATELESIGWDVINISPTLWKDINNAETRRAS